MVAGLAAVLGVVPLCSYVRVQRLQGVALTSSLPSKKETARLAAACPAEGLCRPAVLLPCWALGAEPEDLDVAFQLDLVRAIPSKCISLVVPFCQERMLASCKCWVHDPRLGFANISTVWTASPLGDSVRKSCFPMVTTVVTEPPATLIAFCYHVVRCGDVCCIVPLSCNLRSFGSQRVVLAYCLAGAQPLPCRGQPLPVLLL